MKKNLILIIVLFVLFVFCFVDAEMIYVSASTDVDDVLTPEEHWECLEEAISSSTVYNSSITEYHSYLVSYYDNLTYNFGMNYKGSCGYVAIGMLLSYYDTFLNDSIIPEQYDLVSNGYDGNMITRRNSPGVLKDIIARPNTPSSSSYGYSLSATEYYSYVNSYSATSLHAKLIMLGAERGYYDFSDDDTPAGTDFFERNNILNDYFQKILGYDLDDYTLDYIDMDIEPSRSNEVRDFAIRKVKNNQPVLLSIGKSNGSGHVVVAYDYDEITDKLYCHFGWGANKTHVTIESQNYSVYRTALTIDFETTHSHSNNYGITSISNNTPTSVYYCFDNSIITLLSHNFSYNFISLGETGHEAYCECGTFITASHVYDKHYCIKCNEYTLTHDYDSNYEWISYTRHNAECICGSKITQGHVVSSSSYLNGSQYLTCLLCGGMADMGFIQMSINSNLITKVTINGSYKLPNGIIVLDEKDLQSYLNNTLVFYDKNEIPLIK